MQFSSCLFITFLQSLLLPSSGLTIKGNVTDPVSLSKLDIPHCAYINLARRQDRRKHMESELAKVNLACARLEAVDSEVLKEQPDNRTQLAMFHKAGHIEDCTGFEASRRSHIAALKQIEDSGAPYGLVLEDDVEWTADAQTLHKVLSQVRSDIKQHPVILLDCCDMNIVGVDMASQPLLSPGLKSGAGCLCTTAYIIRNDYISVLRSLWESDIVKAPHCNPIDQVWKSLQGKDQWARVDPLLMQQVNTVSDSDTSQFTGLEGLELEIR